jgi:hypothetical protein
VSKANPSTVRLPTQLSEPNFLAPFSIPPDSALAGWWVRGDDAEGLFLDGPMRNPSVSLLPTFLTVAENVDSEH